MPSLAPHRGETRLLVATLVVSAVMLLLLARLRFPGHDGAPAPMAVPPPAPLERLAVRATYEELASILRGVHRQVERSVAEVRVANDVSPDAPPAYVPALRMPGGQAVALVGIGRRVLPPDGSPGAAGDVLATDRLRGVVVVRASDGSDLVEDAPQDLSLPSPGYLAAVEATRSGPAVRPLYFGRADRVADPRWPAPVLRLSALQQMLPAGALVFTLDGRFVGAGVPDERDLLVVPGAQLRAEAERAVRQGSIGAADLGLEVQRLDARLRAATGATFGVVVTYVHPKGPSEGLLQPGDVISTVGGTAIHSVADYAGATMELSAGTPVTLDVERAGSARPVSVIPTARVGASGETASVLGLELREVRGAGCEVVRVEPRSAAAFAGLESGDLITAFAGRNAPTRAAIIRAFADGPSGARLLAAVERGPSHLVTVLVKP